MTSEEYVLSEIYFYVLQALAFIVGVFTLGFGFVYESDILFGITLLLGLATIVFNFLGEKYHGEINPSGDSELEI